MHMHSLIEFNEYGIYCPQADLFIDPIKPVKKALITHAHGDHSRPGSGHYLAHTDSELIMKQRLGEQIKVQTVDYRQTLHVNGVEISYHPAGHIPGSAQIKLSHKGFSTVISGDYKLADDGISTPFESVKCNEFVTESTFGLPIYQWPEQATVFEEINAWWRKNQAEGKVSVLFAYALGKAQRILANIDPSIGKIYTHGAVENATEVLRKTGLKLPETILVTKDIPKKEYTGSLVIATPASIGSPWMKKFSPYSTGITSGWMMLRGTRRREAADRGFVLSDHADWNGLLTAVKNSEADRVYVTHGYTNAFSRYLEELGYDAYATDSLFEGESLDTMD